MPSKYQTVKKYDSGHSVWREYDKAKRYTNSLRIPFYVENNTNAQGIVTIKRSANDSPILTINASTDNETWSLAGDTTDLTNGLQITLPANGRIYLKCETNSWSPNSPNIITCNKSHNVGGNIMSLLYGTSGFFGKTSFPTSSIRNFYDLFFNNGNLVDVSDLELPAMTLTHSCYGYMFYGCTSLINTPHLRALTLAPECYRSMFEGCTSLTTTPELPAITLTSECYRSMFEGCTSLITTPELPATTLSGGCYRNIFKGCTSLNTAPTLPAYTLDNECYEGMFRECTALTVAPELPATALAGNCYYAMFKGCTSLTTAPSLPATALSDYCYSNMFEGCTALTTASALPATTLLTGCYRYMFAGCTALATAPELPATTLNDWCYGNMFERCTSLTTAPELPATTLSPCCYWFMFASCPSINEIKIYADDISADNCLMSWLGGVASTGTFHKLGTAAYTPDSTSGIPHGWNVDDVMTTPLNIKNTSDETNTLSIVKSDENAPSITVEYSIDNSTWSTLGTTSTTPLEYNIPVGGKIYLRAATQRWCGYQSSNANIISCNKPHSVSGNIMSLLYGPSFNGTETSLNNGYEFKMLFKNDVHLDTDGLQLPATTLLSKQNYHSMFYGCASLTTPPSTLPATTASVACYYQMFYECTSLTRAPKISATILNESSCAYMFYGCSSLVEVPDLSITQVVLQSCMWMFQNCTSLVKAPALPATALFLPNNAGSCYMGMFLGCTSLTTAPPVLPATNGTGQCYAYMFQNCTSLLNTPEIFLDDIIGCKYMFSGCSDVKEITVHANSITNGETLSWLSGVSSTGTFRNLGTAVYPANSASGIPSGWTEVHQ